jgi:hypothetical protein
MESCEEKVSVTIYTFKFNLVFSVRIIRISYIVETYLRKINQYNFSDLYRNRIIAPAKEGEKKNPDANL